MHTNKVLVTHLCLTLCDPIDCSPPGSSVCGSFQVRIPEQVAIPSNPGLPHCRQILYHLSHQGRLPIQTKSLSVWKCEKFNEEYINNLSEH